MNPTGSRLMPDFTSRRTAFHYTTALNTLIKLGVNLNRVEMLAVGEHENYRGEIREQEPAPGTELGPSTKITLKVGYPSAVDEMPYQFFYGLGKVRSSTGGWEEAARCLMAPYDAAVIRYQAFCKFNDLKSNLGLIDYGHLQRFLSLFDFALVEETRDLGESIVWSSVFPFFNEWSGSAGLVCRVLKALFGFDFEIRENTPVDHGIPKKHRSKLGAARDKLGTGFILGAGFRDYDSGFELIVKNVDQKRVRDLLPGGKTRQRIERAMSIFMPSSLLYGIKIKVRGPRVAIGKKERKSFLGYTSYIGT